MFLLLVLRKYSIPSAFFALNPLKDSDCLVRPSKMPIESNRPNRPYCPVEDIPSLMHGCRALNLGVHIGFRMDSTSRRKVGKNDGQSKEETDGIIANHSYFRMEYLRMTPGGISESSDSLVERPTVDTDIARIGQAPKSLR